MLLTMHGSVRLPYIFDTQFFEHTAKHVDKLKVTSKNTCAGFSDMPSSNGLDGDIFTEKFRSGDIPRYYLQL